MGGPSSTSGSEAEGKGEGAHAVAADVGSRRPGSSVLILDLGQAVPTRLPGSSSPTAAGMLGRSWSGRSATPRVRRGARDVACHSLCCPP